MMKTKILSFLTLFIILFLSCSTVFAAAANTIESSKTTLELVDKSICEMDLNGMGHFKKELIYFDSEKRELTITLTVTNTAKKETIEKPVELFLVLDNSNSMTKTYLNKTKMEYVTQTANLFVDSLFEHFSNVKIGVVRFSSIDPVVPGGVSLALGTTSDATLLLPLSDTKETIKNTVTSYSNETGPYTNIEAGLDLAQANFSDSTESEKYIVLISDGVPNLSLDTENTLSYSGSNAANTKKKLQAIQNKGYHIFSVLMGLNESNVPNTSAPLVEGGDRHMTYGELAEEIFGTKNNPTAGDFYFINYDHLDTTINGDIYDDITYVKDNSLKNIVVKDYIPQKIMDNFDFMHSVAPNIGTVTDKVDTTDNNSITWTIPILKEEEVATLSYKLKLKDTVQKQVLNEVLPTNTKVDIDFETPDGEKKTVTSDVSPKVKITYEEPKKPDNTVDPNPLPQTGNYTTLFVCRVATIAILFGFTRIVYLKKLK